MKKISKTYSAIEVSGENFGGTLKYQYSSKSELHRLLICAALSNCNTHIICKTQAKDVFVTIECLCALGAKIEEVENGFRVEPIDKSKLASNVNLSVGDSGSTFRFLLPVICALGISCTFSLSKRLSERPIKPLIDELIKHGANIYWDECDTTKLHCSGKITGNSFTFKSVESSQFISGILLALPICGGGNLDITDDVESRPYINMTIEIMRVFGIDVSKDAQSYRVSGKYNNEKDIKIYADIDWSNAAFWLCAGAISKKGVQLCCPCNSILHSGDNATNDNSASIDKGSCSKEDKLSTPRLNKSLKNLQGDEKILEILNSFGANVEQRQGKNCMLYTISPRKTLDSALSASSLQSIDLDASDIPDLIPIIALVATAAQGITRIYNVGRLRLKESDRLEAICDVLGKLGAKVQIANNNELVICGPTKLHGACVSSHNDHRIAMMAACASIICDKAVKIEYADAINKSYPSFFDDFTLLDSEVKDV